MPHMRFIESEPSFHFLSVALEDDGRIIVEVLHDTAIKKCPILRHKVDRGIPIINKL